MAAENVRCWDGTVFSLRSDSEARRLERSGILQIVTGSHDDKLKYKHEFRRNTHQESRQIEAEDAAPVYATREMKPRRKPGRPRKTKRKK